MAGDSKGKVCTVDDFVTLFYAVGVGGRVNLLVVETKAVLKAYGCRNEGERCSEQERVCITYGKFLLVLRDLETGGKFVEMSDKIFVLGVCLCTETVNLFVEETVAGFSGNAFGYIQMHV